MTIEYGIAILLGLIGTSIGIIVARRFNIERELFGYSLLIGSSWYVVFGILDGQSLNTLVPQIVAALVFACLALLGLRRSIAFIGIGWGLHIFWDYSAHMFGEIAAPWWTAPACLGFDPFVAAYLIARSKGLMPLAREQQIQT